MSEKTPPIQDFLPREGELRPQYTSADFDHDVDPARDDFNEGLVLPDINTEPMYVNIGPTHPATHGTFRIYAKLDGETHEADWVAHSTRELCTQPRLCHLRQCEGGHPMSIGLF